MGKSHHTFRSSDLVHTTESLRTAKLSAGQTEADVESHDSLLEPYRAENARLVRENNELHLELLRVKEEKDRVARGEQVSFSSICSLSCSEKL